MQTIIVEADRAIEDILKLNLEAFAGTDVVARKSSDEVMELLSIIPTVSLIIMRVRIGDDLVAKNISKFLKEKKLAIPCIIIGDIPAELYPDSTIIPLASDWEAIVQAAFTFLGVSSESPSKESKTTFIPIDIRFFFEINEPPCDVYVRIRQNTSDYEYQYIKLIHSGNGFDHSLIEKYEYQGLTDFYIEEDYHQFFVTCMTSSLLKKLGRDDLTEDQRIISNDNAYRVIADQLSKLDLDEAAIELTHACIKSMKKTTMGSEKLSELLGRLFSNRISYAYQKAHLTFIIATVIIKKIEGHGNEDINTLGYAAFFADSTLKSQKQLSILNYQNFMTSNLNLAEKTAVEFHARQISKIVEETGMFSENLTLVLREHHGAKDGAGFPRNFPRTLHYLSYLFIVCDYFVSTLLHPRKPSNKADIVEIISAELTSKQFKPYLEALRGKLE